MCLPIQLYGWLGKIYWNFIPEKEGFYSHQNMEDITDADHAPAKRVCKDFK